MNIDRVFSLICNNSGFAIQNLINTGISSIILTRYAHSLCRYLYSGTLSPLRVISSELQLSFQYQLQNSHVIQPNQVLINFILLWIVTVSCAIHFSNKQNINSKIFV